MSVIVYSISNCPKCAAAKALLKRKGIAFEEFNIQEDKEKNAEAVKKIEAGGSAIDEISAPVLDIDGIVSQGFDKEKILAALKEKGLLTE